MTRKTVYCLCEGYSEKNLVQKLLTPHFARLGVDLHAPLVRTRRNKKASRPNLGGGDTFAHYKKDLELLGREHGATPQRLLHNIDLPLRASHRFSRSCPILTYI